MDPIPAQLVLFDGVCGFCDLTVQWLLLHDRGAVLRFAPLQGPTAAALRLRHSEIPESLDTVVFLDEGRVYVRSQAFLQLARHLPSPWRWATVLRFVPSALLDVGYRVIAATRYRIFGKHDACRIPRPAERARFLP